MRCTHSVDVGCEHLYWGMGPNQFLNLYNEKAELDKSFFEYCEESKTPFALYIEFIFDFEVTKKGLESKQSFILVKLSFLNKLIFQFLI